MGGDKKALSKKHTVLHMCNADSSVYILFYTQTTLLHVCGVLYVTHAWNCLMVVTGINYVLAFTEYQIPTGLA